MTCERHSGWSLLNTLKYFMKVLSDLNIYFTPSRFLTLLAFLLIWDSISKCWFFIKDAELRVSPNVEKSCDDEKISSLAATCRDVLNRRLFSLFNRDRFKEECEPSLSPLSSSLLIFRFVCNFPLSSQIRDDLFLPIGLPSEKAEELLSQQQAIRTAIVRSGLISL